MNLERDVLARLPEKADALQAHHVADLVRVFGDRRRAVWQHAFGKVRRRDQRALDVQVRVHQSWRCDQTTPLDHLSRLAPGRRIRRLDHRDLTLVDANVRGVHLTRDDVGERDVANQCIQRNFAESGLNQCHHLPSHAFRTAFMNSRTRSTSTSPCCWPASRSKVRPTIAPSASCNNLPMLSRLV